MDIEETIVSILRQYESVYQERQQIITLQANENIPTIQADGVKIGRVLSSLVSNAVKFTPQSGNILINVSMAQNEHELPPAAPEDVMLPAVVISILDSGEGVPESEAEAIFEPFHRAKNAAQLHVSGAGLGLAIARSLVDLHRGSIWAQPASRKYAGGQFHFTLPISTIL
jgi:signal transduction histidine kinase